jgi:hypothetical protein
MSGLTDALRQEEERLCKYSQVWIPMSVDRAANAMAIRQSAEGKEVDKEKARKDGEELVVSTVKAGVSLSMISFRGDVRDSPRFDVMNEQSPGLVSTVSEEFFTVVHYFSIGHNDITRAYIDELVGQGHRLLEHERKSLLGLNGDAYVVGVMRPGWEEPTIIAQFLLVEGNTTQDDLELLMEREGLDYERIFERPGRSNDEAVYQHGLLLIEKGKTEEGMQKLRNIVSKKEGENPEYEKAFEDALAKYDPKYQEAGLSLREKIEIYDHDHDLDFQRLHMKHVFSERVTEGREAELLREEAGLFRTTFDSIYSKIPARTKLHAEITAEAEKHGISFEKAKDIVKERDLAPLKPYLE